MEKPKFKILKKRLKGVAKNFHRVLSELQEEVEKDPLNVKQKNTLNNILKSLEEPENFNNHNKNT